MSSDDVERGAVPDGRGLIWSKLATNLLLLMLGRALTFGIAEHLVGEGN
jgi:hypothetical protein